MASRFTNPFPRFFNNNGAILANGRLTYYEADSTTLKKDIYLDPNLETVAPNPILLTKAGTLPDIYLDGVYRVTLEEHISGNIFVQIETSEDVGLINTELFSDWLPDIGYTIGDIVRGSDNEYYLSLESNNEGNNPSGEQNPVFWEKISFLGTYNPNITYSIGNVVIDSTGNIWRSLTDNNLDNEPADNPTDWGPTSEVFQTITEYSALTTYSTGATVKDTTGNLWKSLQDNNVGNTPAVGSSFWDIAIDASGLIPDLIREVRSSPSADLDIDDKGKFLEVPGDTDLIQGLGSASNLGNGWWCYYYNSGIAEINLDPSGSNLIDSLSGYIMYPGECRLIQCDGTNFHTIVIKPFTVTFLSSANFARPPGYSLFKILAWGGGGGGGSANDITGGQGGGGAVCQEYLLNNLDFNQTSSITIGAGGDGSPNGNGADGGNTTVINTSYRAYGGRGGLQLSVPGSGAGTLGRGEVEGSGGRPNGGARAAVAGDSSAGGGGTSTSTGGYGGDSYYGGGGGGRNGSASVDAGQGGYSVYGGGGGGGGRQTDPGGLPGFSTFGGNGGEGGTPISEATNGRPPGGGGGGGCFTASGDGADGRVEISGII